jgi:hypothetical protein
MVMTRRRCADEVRAPPRIEHLPNCKGRIGTTVADAAVLTANRSPDGTVV